MKHSLLYRLKCVALAAGVVSMDASASCTLYGGVGKDVTDRIRYNKAQQIQEDPLLGVIELSCDKNGFMAKYIHISIVDKVDSKVSVDDLITVGIVYRF